MITPRRAWASDRPLSRDTRPRPNDATFDESRAVGLELWTRLCRLLREQGGMRRDLARMLEGGEDPRDLTPSRLPEVAPALQMFGGVVLGICYVWRGH